MNLIIKKYFQKLKIILDAQPLSIRAIFAIILAGTFIFYFGQTQSDLIASSLGVSLALCFCVALVSILSASRTIFKQFKNFSDYLEPNEKLYSETKNSSPLYIPRIKIPPFFYVTINRIFDPIHDIKNVSLVHRLKGTFSPNYISTSLKDTIEFPHRGKFMQTGIKITFGDSLGLTRISKIIPAPRIFKIYPKPITIHPIPIMAASAQLGDIEHSNLERTGDLFDIREYQAGDSLKRVLWKVYARSGNVVIRQPEPAIVPEGEVAIYVLAKSNQDFVAASALSYLKILDDQNIIYSLSCLGSNGELANSMDKAEDNIISSANLSDQDEGTSFNKFIENLNTKNYSSKTIVIFAASTTNSNSFEQKILQNITNTSLNHQLEPIFSLAPPKPKFINAQINNELDNTWLGQFDHKIKNLFKFPNKISEKTLEPINFSNFKTTNITYADF